MITAAFNGERKVDCIFQHNAGVVIICNLQMMCVTFLTVFLAKRLSVMGQRPIDLFLGNHHETGFCVCVSISHPSKDESIRKV